MRTLRLRAASTLLCLAVALALVSASQAQSRITADKGAAIDIFGGFTGLHTDYYAGDINYGATFGADYTRYIKHFHGRIVPSFELRGSLTPGSKSSLKTIQGGFKLGTTYQRFHPYVSLTIGQGIINFPLPPNAIAGLKYYTRDSSFLYNFGGGVSYNVTRDWSVLADYQYQYWDLGRNNGSLTPFRFYPQAATLGVVYRIPFKAYKTF